METVLAARNPKTEIIEALRKGKRVTVQLDRDVAESVIALALRDRRSISSAVNALVAEALEARAAARESQTGTAETTLHLRRL